MSAISVTSVTCKGAGLPSIKLGSSGRLRESSWTTSVTVAPTNDVIDDNQYPRNVAHATVLHLVMVKIVLLQSAMSRR